jgi:hypothetical protein
MGNHENPSQDCFQGEVEILVLPNTYRILKYDETRLIRLNTAYYEQTFLWITS